MSYRDLSTNKWISRAKYEELAATGAPVEEVSNRKRAATAKGAVITETVEEEKPAPRSARMKPGAKKVAAQTNEAMTEVVAGVLLMTTSKLVRDERKQLEKAEAQSIGAPLVRIGARHVPDWLKGYLPDATKNDDLSDLAEVGLTLLKWGMRAVIIAWQDFDRAQEARRQRRAGNEPSKESEEPAIAPRQEQEEEESEPQTTPNPLIAAFGFETGAAGVVA